MAAEERKLSLRLERENLARLKAARIRIVEPSAGAMEALRREAFRLRQAYSQFGTLERKIADVRGPANRSGR